MNEPKELTYDNLPKALVEEINNAYAGVTYDLGSDVTPTTRSFKSHTKITGDDIVKGVAVDPETFAPIAVRGRRVTAYLVRYDTEANVVRRIVEHNYMETVEVIGPLEPLQDNAVL